MSLFEKLTVGHGTQSSPVNCCWPSPAQSFLVSSPIGTHDLIYVRSKTLFRIEEGFEFLSRRYVCCAATSHVCIRTHSRSREGAEKFFAFYNKWRSTSMLKTGHHWKLYVSKWIQPTASAFFKINCIIVLPTLKFPKWFLPFRFFLILKFCVHF
jgi:hypothetical protein